MPQGDYRTAEYFRAAKRRQRRRDRERWNRNDGCCEVTFRLSNATLARLRLMSWDGEVSQSQVIERLVGVFAGVLAITFVMTPSPSSEFIEDTQERAAERNISLDDAVRLCRRRVSWEHLAIYRGDIVDAYLSYLETDALLWVKDAMIQLRENEDGTLDDIDNDKSQ